MLSQALLKILLMRSHSAPWRDCSLYSLNQLVQNYMILSSYPFLCILLPVFSVFGNCITLCTKVEDLHMVYFRAPLSPC